MGILCADHVTPLYPRNLALTSPTGGGRSVGIVRLWTKATEFVCLLALRIDKALNQGQVTQSFQKSRVAMKFLGARRLTKQVLYGPTNMGRNIAKFMRPADLALMICAPLVETSLKAVRSLETSVTVYQSTRRHIQRGQNQ